MAGKKIARTCNICQERIVGDLRDWLAHGNENHPNHFLQGFDVKHPDPKFSEKNYWCPLDSKWYESRKYLARAIKAHGWTNAKYYQVYGKDHMPIEWEANANHETVGDAHNTDTCKQCGSHTPFQSGKWTYPAFCGYKCSTKWYAANTSRVDAAMDTLKKRKEDDSNHHLRPNQKQYWINKGFTADEAVEKVKQRNNVNSLEKYIERAGGDVFEGACKWRSRINKWKATLDDKPDAEKERIRRLKVSAPYKPESYSTLSKNLFDAVAKEVGEISYGPNETTIRLSSFFVKPDCLVGRKVIEFFGDYWHANPSKYQSGDLVARGKTATAVWAKDKLRLAEYKQNGYDVLVIWESVYKADPKFVIQQCINFLRKGHVTKTDN